MASKWVRISASSWVILLFIKICPGENVLYFFKNKDVLDYLLYLMQIYEPIWRPSKPGPFLAGLYLNSQSIMLMKNAFIMTNQGHIAYQRAETSSGEDGICIKQQSMQQWMLLPYYYTHTQQIMFVSFRI